MDILDGDDWRCEPAMRPEDELLLKNLHDMLQSTADDLRELSTEIKKSRQNGIQVRTQPTPLDDQFNLKVHIKEAVDAKFNGRILVDKKEIPIKLSANDIISLKNKSVVKDKKVNAGVQVTFKDSSAIAKKFNASSMKKDDKDRSNELKFQEMANSRVSQVSVGYEEMKHETQEEEIAVCSPERKCTIHEMPNIEIRSQLKEQRVVNLNILPDDARNKQPIVAERNNAVIEVHHDGIINEPNKAEVLKTYAKNDRKFVKLPESESSEPNIKSNSESDTHIYKGRVSKMAKVYTQKSLRMTKSGIQLTMHRERNENKNKDERKSPTLHSVSDDWRRKLNVIYGKPSTSNTKRVQSKIKLQSTLKMSKSDIKNNVHKAHFAKRNSVLNSAEYVPYSKLTLGGVNVSDIENEIGNVRNKADLPLSPILDKILSIHDDSLQESPKKQKNLNRGPFSISDENLLKEVLDIDMNIDKTLNKKLIKKRNTAETEGQHTPVPPTESNNNSYDDDFEEELEKSDHSVQTNNIRSISHDNIYEEEHDYHQSEIFAENGDKEEVPIYQNTYTKSPNLSLKTAVDVFEYVHAVHTQDNATQSNATQKISLKETQTSPRNESNVQPIHNELWNTTSLDTSGELDKMFKLEKDFIKNLIIEEYGDLFQLQKNITKPSTSARENSNTRGASKNIAMHPKNTQTSPARVKSIMTSPLTTKNTYTSPLRRNLALQRQPSPFFISDQGTSRVLESDVDEAGITINLSSPRFKLRLPQSSREIISNLDAGESSEDSRKLQKTIRLNKDTQTSKHRVTTSESEKDGSESDISSLGEINWRIRRRNVLRRGIKTESESSSASFAPSSSDNVVPMKSEGELSLSQI